MQALAVVLLLVLSASAKGVANRHSITITDPEIRRSAPMRFAGPDPCVIAREIARQPVCLASGDCRALRIWKRAFGRPRHELLDPQPPRDRILAAGPRAAWWPPGAVPDTGPKTPPGVVCPAPEYSPR